jgi:cytidine deaminase
MNNNSYRPLKKFHRQRTPRIRDFLWALQSCSTTEQSFWAGANYPGKAILKMAIYAQSEDFLVETPVYPCGSCRQVMSEYERIGGQPIRIIMVAATGKTHAVNGLINILPVAFDADKLKRQK